MSPDFPNDSTASAYLVPGTATIKYEDLGSRNGARPNIAADDGGIGAGYNLRPPVPNGNYGVVEFSNIASQTVELSGWVDANGSQEISGRQNSAFYIYHETGHGLDDYIVVYQEDGLVSVGDSLLKNFDGIRGYFLYRVINSILPSYGGDSAYWINSAPSSVNQSTEKQDTTVDTTSISINLSTKDSSVDQSVSTQIWHESSMKITDWNVEETSDPASNKCQWMWFQNLPWSGTVGNKLANGDYDPGDFASWWQDAYSGDDAVLSLTEISTSSLQYHCNAAWRFPASLVQDGQLNVTFTGRAQYHFGAIGNRGNTVSGRHQIAMAWPENQWTKTIDLVAKANLK